MRYILVLLFVLFLAFPLSSQEGSQDINGALFVNQISNKDIVSTGDAVKFFVLTIGKRPSGFNANINTLKSAGIPIDLDSENEPIRRGDLAFMIATHLDLGDSFLFLLFKSNRYAFRVCVANNIMDYSSNEWDKISGGELIEIMNNLSERIGGSD